MLDLKLLQQALSLAKHRNFARAAESLHMTQPALSRSIAGLEAALGEKLFNRTPQGVDPTAFGVMLLSRAERLLGDAREIERDFTLLRGLDIGELHVGVGVYPAELSVGPALGDLMRQHPALHVNVVLDDLRRLIDGVRERRLDLAVVELSLVDGDARFATEALPTHPGVFFCRTGHPLAAERHLTIEHIVAFPFAGPRLPKRVAMSYFRAAKAGSIDPESSDYLPPVKVDSVRLAKEVVLRSDAVAIATLPLIAAEVEAGRIQALPLQLPWMHTAYGFVFLRDRGLSPAAQAFMAAVRTVEDELVAREQAFIAPPRGRSASRSKTKSTSAARRRR